MRVFVLMKFKFNEMGKKTTFILLLLLINSIGGSTIPDENDNSLQDQIDRLSRMLEKLDSLHSASIDKQFSSVTNAVNQVDSNVRTLHEKTATWNIFLHHVQAWTDSMKAIDHKVDLIKLAQDETENLENKLNSMEFSINHILTKLDVLNERSRSMNPDVLDKIENINKIVQSREHAEAEDRKEVSKKLNAIMRHILNLDYSRSRESRRAKMSRGTPSEAEYYNQNFEAIEYKIDRVLELLSGISDLEEVMTIQRKNLELLKNIQELVQAIDERSVRLYDAEAQHSSKILSCCRHSSDELTTFTGSSDLLLKRIEKLVADVQQQVRKLPQSNRGDEQSNRESNTKTSNGDEILVNVKPLDKTNNTSKNGFGDKEGPSVAEKSDDNEKDHPKVDKGDTPVNKPPSSEEEEEEEEVTEVIKTRVVDLPQKTGCDKIEERIDGIYRFKNSSNDEVRNYHERYCTFPTDGPGWTVIQRRGPYEIQENFNRTWEDYKYGFGDFHRDFWFGNEFIHRMVLKEIHELRIEMEDFEGTQVWAEYSIFQIESEKYNYKLLIGGYRGSVTDSMLYSDGMEFSTYDRQHDRTGLAECCSCAVGYGSGWWFDNCSEANLNGIYRDTPKGHNYIGIVWENWHGDYSVKKTRMLIRPRNIWRDEDDNDEDVFSNIPSDP